MSRAEAAFGPFRFDRSSGILLDGQNLVQLGSRARALLGALIEKPGELIPKAQLYERAWPGLQVDERNLRVQISGLRKALGDHGALIRTEASLGYRFTGRLSSDASTEIVAAGLPHHALSTAVAPLGRDEMVNDLIRMLSEGRLVTVLGPGGVGKTVVALAVARRMEREYRDGVHFVDLGGATDERQVHAAVACSLGRGESGCSIEQVVLALRGRQTLLILDSCEHVAEYVAALAERILRETEKAVVLATSRESLRVGGEIVWRLEPLEVPPANFKAVAKTASAYRSVQMFLQVARQHALAFHLDDGNASSVVAICRRLDGIPLAIELAASMVGVLDLDEIQRGLDERFPLLTMERRTAIPRHSSMSAAVEWSYGLLSAEERSTLYCLAKLHGWFSLDAALAIASDGTMRPEKVRNVIVALANKSLLNVSQQVSSIQYRLLETTRAYVLQRHENTRTQDLARTRQTAYSRKCFERVDREARASGLAQVDRDHG
ncbi:ATP-binding protein [Tardiphaga sp. 42S5]|uniref:ATP-binding protein n=1 Tax=Tardiphaga sp. 42S5 TaxID=1404799 RepID=UPI002A5AC538|nr:winged helix-turn-helix domain-containing protein [Tardiphaga sp. 42S5]WPO42534.1 winged helix-turn-helix domain-containing protein [Tardiphaga sp. 42S5]